MKVLCIHLPYREDRKKTFEEGVGKNIPFEYLDAVDRNKQTLVSDYAECAGSLSCRASHALAWCRCLFYGENTLVFEDDVLTRTDFDSSILSTTVDSVTGNTVAFFDDRLSTHAYVVTPESAMSMLDRHLRIVNPINQVQMSVDHRMRFMRKSGFIDISVVDGFSFYQHGLRKYSDNDWKCPLGLNKVIVQPTSSNRK